METYADTTTAKCAGNQQIKKILVIGFAAEKGVVEKATLKKVMN